MDIEFHYYMTYLIAKKSKIPNKDARVLAHASQYVDDNCTIFEIDKDKETYYSNYISQTMNIFKPKAKLFRIYPLFHFIPGDPMSPTAYRRDGNMHWLNTTPNSKNANKIIDKALETNDMYRIGIATHGYVDTWAHQNFVGYMDAFNAMAGPLVNDLIPNIGHADAKHQPDWPALIWKDERLIQGTVNNTQRFLDAAEHLCRKLSQHFNTASSSDALETRVGELRNDLTKAIGEPDSTNELQKTRIARYKALAETSDYGDEALPDFDDGKWFEEAVSEEVRGLRDRSDKLWTKLDPLKDIYSWKDKANYRDCHWYRFQAAVKTHQNETWDILSETNFKGLDLPHL